MVLPKKFSSTSALTSRAECRRNTEVDVCVRLFHMCWSVTQNLLPVTQSEIVPAWARLRMRPPNCYRLAAKLGCRSTAIEKWRCSPATAMGLFASVGRGAVIFMPTNLLTPRSSIVTP